MKTAWTLASLACAGLLAWLPAAASPLVTGNGFGFAVVRPETGGLSKFFAHPYSFTRADSHNPLGEGVETANFIQEIGWSGDAQGATVEYLGDSHVIDVKRSDGEGLVFMPFGLRRAALVVSWEPGAAKGGGWQVKWNRPVSSQRALRLAGAAMQVLRFEGIEERLLLIPLRPKRAQGAGIGRDAGQALAGRLGWALVSVETDGEAEAAAREFIRWRGGLTARELANREIGEMERWRVKPAVSFTSEKERRLWRQSEAMLRMAQSREPNRPGRNGNGLIVACLPDGLFFTPWVRDMAVATMALVRMGHRDEARAALVAYFNARPTGKMRAEVRGADYQVSVVRYFGDGEEEPFFTMEGASNIEFDDWGLVLWVLGEYERRFGDEALLRTATYRGGLYESARDYVVKPLVANLDKYGDGLIVAEDTSIWEEHQKDRKHFAFSTAMAIVGLKEFAEVARRGDDEAARTKALEKVALLENGFRAAFIRGGKLHGTLEEWEKNDIDGALLAIINLGVVTDEAVVRDTVERMALLKVASGGYKRVRSNYTDPAIYEYWYEKEEFLFVDFSLAELYRRMGRKAEADAILKGIVDKSAADHNVIPEMYVAVPCKLFPGAIGDATGALPMVGYGAGEYILHVLEREELERGR
jgi:hypothetical protein